MYLFCIPHQRHHSESYKSWNTTRLVHSLLMSFHSLCTVIESTKCFLFPAQKLSVSGSMQTELLQSQVDGKLHWHPLISSCSHTLFPMFHYRTVPRGLAMTHYVHQPIELPCKEDLSEHIEFSLNSSVSRTRKLGPGTKLPYTAVHACMVRKSELRHGLKG